MELRNAQQDFIKRGLASSKAAKKSGIYFSSDEVLKELDHILASTKKKSRK